MNQSVQFESENRADGIKDLEFKLGGEYQWPETIRAKRKAAKRPMLTVNRLPTFTDQIIGDSRANKISIKVKPDGPEGNTNTALTYDGLIKNILKQSDADSVFQWGLQGAADSGRGAWRVINEHEPGNPFDNELLVERIKNAYSVYLDPRAKKWTYSDSRWMFLAEYISRDDFADAYPGKQPTNLQPGGVGDTYNDWWDGDDVRVAEYWRRTKYKKRVYLLDDHQVVDADAWDKKVKVLEEEEAAFSIDEDGLITEGAEGPGKVVVANPVPLVLDEGEIDAWKVEQFIVDGGQILKYREWPGQYIPVILCWGKEIDLNGKSYYRGIIRNARDPQRMYNYERTAEIEQVALAKKAPVRVTPKMIQGHEHEWNSDESRKYVKFNPDPAFPGGPIDTPPPMASSGNVTGYAQSNDELKATTGIFDASLGARSNETSGIAIQRRESAANVANFEYHDNQARAVKYTGDILVDLIPYIYDRERTILIIGEDDAESWVTINEKIKGENGKPDKVINDMTTGKYRVSVTVGPSFKTQREETLDTLLEAAAKIPIFAEVGADMIAKNIDFKGADELARRIQTMMDPKLLEKSDEEGLDDEQKPPSPEEIMAQVEQQKLQAEMEGQQMELQKKELDVTKALIDLQGKMAEMEGKLNMVAEKSALQAVQHMMKMFQAQREGEGRRPQGQAAGEGPGLGGIA
jgi:hypothetical protein